MAMVSADRFLGFTEIPRLRRSAVLARQRQDEKEAIQLTLELHEDQLKRELLIKKSVARRHGLTRCFTIGEVVRWLPAVSRMR
jgi:hypothetical protein